MRDYTVVLSGPLVADLHRNIQCGLGVADPQLSLFHRNIQIWFTKLSFIFFSKMNRKKEKKARIN
jgi:hypothetical protein